MILFRNYIYQTDFFNLIKTHWRDPQVYIGSKNTQLLIREITQSTALATGFKSPGDVYGLTDHDSQCKSKALALDYIAQDKKVLMGKKLFILDILPSVHGSQLLFTTRIPLINNTMEIIGSVFFASAVTEKTVFGKLAHLLSCSDGKNGSSLILNEESVLLNNASNELTQKELEILWLLARGLNAKEVARFLSRSPRTIEDHIERLKDKCHCASKGELVEKAINNGIFNYLPISFANKKTTDILLK